MPSSTSEELLWGHLRHANSFGPAPPSRNLERPWLLNGRPAATTGGRGRVRCDPEGPQPPPARAGSVALASTEASRQRQRETATRRQRDAASPRQPPDTARLLGPCAERALPLSKHAPRQLRAPERRRAPAWQPSYEWRSWHLGGAHQASRPHSRDRVPATPLAGFSPRVVEQCAAEAAAAHAEAAEPYDAAAAAAARAEGAAGWSARATDGGWAVDVRVPTAAGAYSIGDPSEADTAAWPLDYECAAWRQRAAAQRQQRLRRLGPHAPCGTLAVVDDFLSGPLAAAFLPSPTPGT